MLDPISDMLTRIRNASRAGHQSVRVPASRLKLAIARILVERGFIERAEKIENGPKADIVVTLRYKQVSPVIRTPVIRNLRRVSHEGCRVYVKRDDIRKVKNGYGIAIISTPQGVMAGEDAYRKQLGGEYICEVW